ncbi:hypothetical protein ACI3EJ_01900 [Ligilactobacillus acidipiscis]|uniref:hypothetical protein n=1 Tax=Ligilactobacillus acidipiscis TaxID=89059 RepID=UPI003862EA15
MNKEQVTNLLSEVLQHENAIENNQDAMDAFMVIANRFKEYIPNFEELQKEYNDLQTISREYSYADAKTTDPDVISEALVQVWFSIKHEADLLREKVPELNKRTKKATDDLGWLETFLSHEQIETLAGGPIYDDEEAD